jgi:quercetin dioxygenase-like cupin family protein
VNDERSSAGVANLLEQQGTGPLRGMASDDLNATLLVWPAGHEVGEHTNTDLDVLLIVLEGEGLALIDEQAYALSPGHALLIPKGSSRAIRAGAAGVRYVSVHSRRGPLQIEGLPGSRKQLRQPTPRKGQARSPPPDVVLGPTEPSSPNTTSTRSSRSQSI